MQISRMPIAENSSQQKEVEGADLMSYTTIQISKETYELLYRLQNDLKKITRKKSISMDMLIRLLLFIKMDASDVLIEIEKLLEAL